MKFGLYTGVGRMLYPYLYRSYTTFAYLRYLYQGDRSLTDIVQGEENRCIRVGSTCYDLTNLAQVILPDGLTFRQEVWEGGTWNKHADTTEWEGMNWPLHIRQALRTGS